MLMDGPTSFSLPSNGQIASSSNPLIPESIPHEGRKTKCGWLGSIGSCFGYAVKGVIMVTYSATVMAIIRYVTLPRKIHAAVCPESLFKRKYRDCSKLDDLLETKETDSNQRELISLQNMNNQVQRLQTSLGIRKVIVVFEKGTVASGNSFGNSSCGILVFTDKVVGLTDNEMNYVVAHEFFHLKRNDDLKASLIPIATMIINVTLAYFVTPWLIFAVEAPIESIISWNKRRIEKIADLSAVKELGTNAGAIAYIQAHLSYNLTKRSQGNRNVSPEGNNLRDKWHPPLTERLAYFQKAEIVL